MANRIYYFSGTGNSLKVAKDIANRLKETEIVPVSKAVKQDISTDFDKVGVVFPVYMWGLPLIVADFFKKLKKSNAYFFAVATYGGMPGAAVVQAAEILKASGIKLSSGFAVRMPGNYAPMYGAFSKAKQNKIFEKAEKKLNFIADSVKEKKENKIEKSPSLFNWIFSKHFYSFASPHIPELDKRFLADEKCTSCGICAKVCPVSNIVLVDGKPVWQHHCQQCFACLQWCPVEAIQYGKNTKGRKRYRHPETKAEDFF